MIFKILLVSNLWFCEIHEEIACGRGIETYLYLLHPQRIELGTRNEKGREILVRNAVFNNWNDKRSGHSVIEALKHLLSRV